MSSSDFRQITIKGKALKVERLFRAAVSAFCSLTRPSRREIAQLEDLTLPLFELVSIESRRYASAALSECQYPPAMLVRRLCDETVDIAAPLLIRSSALSAIDLIALIGRHGLDHARAIGRRSVLNPTIAKLVAVLGRKAIEMRPGGPDENPDQRQENTRPAPTQSPGEAETEAGSHGAATEKRAAAASFDDEAERSTRKRHIEPLRRSIGLFKLRTSRRQPCFMRSRPKN